MNPDVRVEVTRDLEKMKLTTVDANAPEGYAPFTKPYSTHLRDRQSEVACDLDRESPRSCCLTRRWSRRNKGSGPTASFRLCKSVWQSTGDCRVWPVQAQTFYRRGSSPAVRQQRALIVHLLVIEDQEIN